MGKYTYITHLNYGHEHIPHICWTMELEMCLAGELLHTNLAICATMPVAKYLNIISTHIIHTICTLFQPAYGGWCTESQCSTGSLCLANVIPTNNIHALRLACSCFSRHIPSFEEQTCQIQTAINRCDKSALTDNALNMHILIICIDIAQYNSEYV